MSLFHQSHNPKVIGSNPVPATNIFKGRSVTYWSAFFYCLEFGESSQKSSRVQRLIPPEGHRFAFILKPKPANLAIQYNRESRYRKAAAFLCLNPYTANCSRQRSHSGVDPTISNR